MSDSLQLVLEDVDGTQLETSCTRFAVVWQGREVWIQQVPVTTVTIDDHGVSTFKRLHAFRRPTVAMHFAGEIRHRLLHVFCQ